MEEIETTPEVEETVVPNSEETPSEVPPEETTETPTETDLFELPDGRKVDGATLATEWKENFAPDYTRKSQELADLKRDNLPAETPKEDKYANPEYVPTSYRETMDAAKSELRAEMEAEKQQVVESRQNAENAVVEQLNEVKKLDSALDENKLFLHATKYGFQDLTMAHSNMKAMEALTKDVQKTTAENIAKRNDPVSIPSGGAKGAQLDPSNFESASDYLRSLNT